MLISQLCSARGFDGDTLPYICEIGILWLERHMVEGHSVIFFAGVLQIIFSYILFHHSEENDITKKGLTGSFALCLTLTKSHSCRKV